MKTLSGLIVIVIVFSAGIAVSGCEIWRDRKASLIDVHVEARADTCEVILEGSGDGTVGSGAKTSKELK